MAAVEWHISEGRIDYPAAVEAMEAQVAAIRAGRARERVWLLEHPPLYTAGTSARGDDLLNPGAIPVYSSGRGGQYTYHGPGQRVAYVMLDLKARELDVRRYIYWLEEWVIQTLAAFNLACERRDGRIGLWVPRPDGSADKIAAIGVRVRRWVSFHGIAINVEPELSHFAGIVPCGISDAGVTSMVREGLPVGLADLDSVLRPAFEEVFASATEATSGDISAA